MDWNPAVLEFGVDRGSRGVYTHTAAQLGGGIFTTSIGAWRQYEDQMGARQLRQLERLSRFGGGGAKEEL